MNQPENQPNQPGARTRVLGAATVFSDYVSILGARVGSAALSLISVLITARLLEPSGYGAVAYYAVVAMLVFTVTSGWTAAAISRFGREEFESRQSLVPLTWARVWISVPLYLASAVVVVALQAAGAFPESFGWTFTALAIGYGGILVVSDHLVYSLEAAGRIKQSALWMIGQHSLIVASLVAVAALDLDVGPVAVASISIAWGAVFMVGLLVAERRLAIWPPRFESDLARRVLRFSLPLIAFTVSQYAIRSVDLFVLGAFASATTVGIYAVAYQAYMVLQQLTTATGPVLTPLFVSLRLAGRERVVTQYNERVVPQLTFLAAILAGLAVPFVELAVPIVFGSSFEDAATPLAILLFATVVGFAANLLAPIVVLHERTGSIARINVVAAVVNIAGDVLLIGVLGLELTGPAIATVVALVVVLAGYAAVSRACTGSSARSALGLVAAALPFAAGFGAAIAFSGVAAVIAATAGVTLVALAVQASLKPFAPSDAPLIAQLDLPGPLKRASLRTLELVGR